MKKVNLWLLFVHQLRPPQTGQLSRIILPETELWDKNGVSIFYIFGQDHREILIFVFGIDKTQL